MRSAIFILVAALLAPGATVGAQTATPLPGARVRLTTPSLPHARQEGTLVVVQADTIYIRRGADSLAIPRAQVTALEASRGVHTHGRKGMGIGFLAGAGLGAMIGLASGDDPPGFLSMTAEEKAVLAGALLGTAGTVVGGVIGLMDRAEKWERMPLADAVRRVGVVPRRGGAALTVALKF